MLLRPWVGSSSPSVDLSSWPSEIGKNVEFNEGTLSLRIIPLPLGLGTRKEAEGRIRKLAKQAEQNGSIRASAKLAWAAPTDGERIDRLWRRVMDPEASGSSFWDLLAKTLSNLPSGEKCSAYLPTPHGPSSLVFTLQRGRSVLEAIASADTRLAMRGNDPTELSLARPWYQGEPMTRVASLSSDVPLSISDVNSPENEEFWLAPYRKRTAAVLAGKTPNTMWLDARALAKAILAGDIAATKVLENVHAAHHLTTPSEQSASYCASPEDELATAKRRLGALLSLPTLQRLFGFAFDLLIDTDYLRQNLSKMETPFVLLAPDRDDASWTLARFDHGSGSGRIFCPASWEEVLGNEENASITFGMRNLALRDEEKKPVFDIITIDTALANESSINNQAAKITSTSKGSALAPIEHGLPILQNGGLRIIEAKDIKDDAKPPRDCLPRDMIEDANALKIGDRLMVGVEIKKGQILWRSPDYRVIKFLDPKPEQKVDAGWIEEELSRRRLSADARRRVELDGAMAMPALQRMADSPPDEPVTTPEDPVTARAIKIIEDSTVALWGSDPGGVPPPEIDQKSGKVLRETILPVIEELDITRHFKSPSRPKNDNQLLSPTLRFGWSYYTALAPVFEGGGSMTPDGVANVSKLSPAVSLPAVPEEQSNKLGGRRFLRHERINAPMSLVLENDIQVLGDMKPPQRSADMYVRSTIDPEHSLASTRRLIVPPPVPLQFAMLHDVLRNSGSNVTVPKQGLPGLSLIGRKDTPDDPKPNRVRVGDISSEHRYVYYPDPAASVMVFGLKLPAEEGLENSPFIEDPIAVPVGARTWPDKSVNEQLPAWPDVVPIHLELKSVDAHPGENDSRLRFLGRRWLTAKGKVVAKAQKDAVQVHCVQVSLARGETLVLQAWCAPTVGQLTEWFDAIESAGLLLVAESDATGDLHAACIDILTKQLKTEFPNDVDRYGKAAASACLGAGGLTAPPRETVQTLAGLTYRELLLKPNSVLASPLTMRVTHAVEDCLIATPQLGPEMAITRRVFAPADAVKTPDAALLPAPQTPANFLNGTPLSDWGLDSIQEGATDTLIGGVVRFDPASTGGLLVEAVSAAPFDESLDNPEMGLTREQRLDGNFIPNELEKTKPFGFILNENGTVDFPRKQITVLKLDGLPLPKDGRSRLSPYPLQDLMAAAWGDGRQFGKALRAALPAAFHCSGARYLSIKTRPINRHSGLLPPRDPKDVKAPPESAPCYIWLPATTRPAPPVIDHVSVALSHRWIKPLINTDNSFTVGVEQSCVLTIWHARPFFSSGEGEKIALVLWPPGLFARGSAKDDNGQLLFPTGDQSEPETTPDFYDEDLGAGGSYVTRWGADPLASDDVSQAKFPTGPLIDPARLSLEGTNIPRAFMPIPISGQTSATAAPDTKQPGSDGDPTQAAADQTPVTYMAVALQAFEPRFDPVQELWYVNVALNTDPLPFPRVRLGLVRYQAHAREDDLPLEGSEPVRLRVSTPVKEWVKPLPGRRATVTCRPRENGRFDIAVAIDGPSTDPDAKEQSARPRMVVEVIRSRTMNGIAQEETVKDIDGNLAECEDWSPGSSIVDGNGKPPKGIYLPSDAGYHWSALFTIEGPLDHDGWSHSVVVRETRQLPRARPEKARSAADTGPIFMVRIPLERETISACDERNGYPKQ
ncbi:hypothetical protein [Mesorhizobium sp. B1-1-5]|uniref:hypothetical protein n=1 Tax=Mesorhizobium sp. B1-1-5 TaxID=2589979 RepID=UPI00112CFF12|nr:hypothetical protein [Mesorhizobium sp. B1-1-5]TPO13737.1 hypothetical protein FJ980_00750 [Mesorhizobium sp. B1-1-5]